MGCGKRGIDSQGLLVAGDGLRRSSLSFVNDAEVRQDLNEVWPKAQGLLIRDDGLIQLVLDLAGGAQEVPDVGIGRHALQDLSVARLRFLHLAGLLVLPGLLDCLT